MLGHYPVSSAPLSSEGDGGGITSVVTGVTVTPATATVTGGADQAFTATVDGTDFPSQAVTWSTDAGSISAGGVLTAPAPTALEQTVTVTATSVENPTFSDTATVTVPAEEAEAADPRYARPASDVTPGAWLPSTGSVLADMIDETTADSTDYIYTTSASECEIALSAVTDPATSSGQVVRYQVWSPEEDALKVTLKQGATTIASWVHASLPTTPTIYARTLTGPECDSITDYSDLRFTFTAA